MLVTERSVPFELPSDSASLLDDGNVGFRLECPKGSEDLHMWNMQGRGRGWCENCRKTKGNTPTRKSSSKKSAHSRHARKGRGGAKKILKGTAEVGERGHYFLNPDGSANLGEFDYEKGDEPDDIVIPNMSVQKWSEYANMASGQAHVLERKSGYSMRTYKQLTAVAVYCRNMSVAGTKVVDAAQNAASCFYVTAKTGDGAKAVSERTIRTWFSVWCSNNFEMQPDRRGIYFRPDVLRDSPEFKIAAVEWLQENTEVKLQTGAGKKRRKRFQRKRISVRGFKDFCNGYFDTEKITTDFYLPDQSQSGEILSIKDTTARRFMHALGYAYGVERKGFVDQHESPEQVCDRYELCEKTFNVRGAQVVSNEQRMYLWKTMVDEEGKEFSIHIDEISRSIEGREHDKGNKTCRYNHHHAGCPDRDGEVARERGGRCNCTGGELHVDAIAKGVAVGHDDPNMRPIMQWFQDESIYYSSAQQSANWHRKKGGSTAPKKVDGAGVMVSGTINSFFGWIHLTPVELVEVRRMQKERKEVKEQEEDEDDDDDSGSSSSEEDDSEENDSEEEDDSEEEGSKKGKPDKKKLFTIHPKFAGVTLFNYGRVKDGYWDTDLMLEYQEIQVDIAEVCFPGVQHVFYFDHSTNHEAFADDALRAKRMNGGWGGKQPKMRSTVFTDASGTVNKQSMVFEKGDVLPKRAKCGGRSGGKKKKKVSQPSSHIGQPKGLGVILMERGICELPLTANEKKAEKQAQKRKRNNEENSSTSSGGTKKPRKAPTGEGRRTQKIHNEKVRVHLDSQENWQFHQQLDVNGHCSCEPCTITTSDRVLECRTCDFILVRVQAPASIHNESAARGTAKIASKMRGKTATLTSKIWQKQKVMRRTAAVVAPVAVAPVAVAPVAVVVAVAPVQVAAVAPARRGREKTPMHQQRRVACRGCVSRWSSSLIFVPRSRG